MTIDDPRTRPLRSVGPTITDAAIVELCTALDFVCTRAQLLDLGLTSSGIDRRVSAGLLARPHRGVYVLAAAARSQKTRIRAAALARPDDVFSHFTAARLHGWPLGHHDRHQEIHMTTDRSRSTRLQRVVVHRSRHLPLEDRTTIDSMGCTTAARTLLDLAPIVSGHRVMDLANQVLGGAFSTKVDPHELEACAAALARRGRSGTVVRREFVAALVVRDDHDLSYAERRFDELCRQHGITGLVAQFVPPWFDGVRGVVDFACPVRRVIFEIDGRAFHSQQAHVDNDRQRDRLARSHGWRVERIGFGELIARPDAIMQFVRTVLEHHAPVRESPNRESVSAQKSQPGARILGQRGSVHPVGDGVGSGAPG